MSKLDILQDPYPASFKEAVHEFVEAHLEPHGLKDESPHTGLSYLMSDERLTRQSTVAGKLLIGLSVLDAASVALVTAGNVRKKDRGPVRYTSNRIDRVGHARVIQDENGPMFIPIEDSVTKVLPIIKTRTMTIGADRRHKVGQKVGSSGSSVTAAGKILRQRPMNVADEIPQLRQARKGQMAVVGPRPMFYDELYSPISYDAFEGNIDALNHANRFYSLSKKGVVGPEVLSGQREVSTCPENTLKRYASIFGWALYCSPDTDTHVMQEVARTIIPIARTKHQKLTA